MTDFWSETGVAFVPGSTIKLDLRGNTGNTVASDIHAKLVGYLMKK